MDYRTGFIPNLIIFQNVTHICGTKCAIMLAGYAPRVLESLDAPNLVLLIKLQTALGQAVGSTLNQDKKESAKAFQDALKVSKGIIRIRLSKDSSISPFFFIDFRGCTSER